MPSITDQTVRKATGKTWEEWRSVLSEVERWHPVDSQGIGNLFEGRTRVIRLVAANGDRGVRKKAGRRRKEKVEGKGYQMGTSKTLPLSLEKLWNFLLSEKGLSLWLGEGVEAPTLPGPETTYHTP